MLRFDHPVIACKLAWPELKDSIAASFVGARFAYQVFGCKDDEDEWISQTVTVHGEAVRAAGGDIETAISLVTQELGRPADKPPTVFFEVHVIPATLHSSSCGIVLRLGHSIFDAIGAFQTLDLLNERIARALGSRDEVVFDWGAEVTLLAEPPPERAKVPWSSDRSNHESFVPEGHIEALRLNKTLPGVPYSHRSEPRIGTGVMKTVPEESLERLLQAARKRGCTLFSILLAVMLLTLLRTNSLEDIPEINTAFYPAPVNLRAKHLKPNLNPRDRTQWRIANVLGFETYILRNLERFVRPDMSTKNPQIVDDVGTLAQMIRDQGDRQRFCNDSIIYWADQFLQMQMWSVVIPR
ncbi:hypothetical protein GLOTRDRAFT_133811 [Gloeophyllum trabeum ATCC 11539]|uniref:CoA-dependent acyltransferase n=1 Tax=Gloeophyllum trabeum (strain ATCC 11539 / FP-39264 / Madison 617) TaxID=670483 RepID=S7RE26_GLOTA|nr:uncharacterized protein GLOTRDRAFT_133811 [Gloeophyllum trabeum ATCC 11539]EPQ50709.1 hypothetical protein GLOTRDRAFT_133811 [Gloeophyllum trabeum ATCC 11539]